MLPVGKLSIQETHYDILSVREDADSDEIRESYKAAILHSHPDKHKQKPFETCDELHETFLKVQKAWEVLSNAKTRALYDKELSASRMEVIVADEVELKEMMVKNSGNDLELFYPCRCGDSFSISSLELEGLGFAMDGNGAVVTCSCDLVPTSVVIPCCSCSLKINLILHST